ncbi:MAG: suppressor of fused domain protein [Pseudomonadales bacterium]|nr:suppressor of fused domain protein [Pseudomonadales bacterium]
MPETRKIMSRDKTSVELYVFPGEDMGQVTRIATIGLSSNKFSDAQTCNSELLMVIPFEVGFDQIETISDYIFDISSYILTTLGRNIKFEDLIPESELAPADWPKALFIDVPRGEPEELRSFHIGMQHVNLSWLVPIFAKEYDLIKTSGIESFDAAIENMQASLVETRRESCV